MSRIRRCLVFGTLSALFAVSGCSQQQTISDPAVVQVNWANVPEPVHLMTYALANMYLDENPTDSKKISVKQSWTEEDHQKMYLISVQGHFQKPNVTKPASVLSFSVLDNASKVWALVAKDSMGNTVWQGDAFDVVVHNNLHFRGHSAHWKGLYTQSDAQVWSDDSYGAWTEDHYSLTYTGGSPKVASHLHYTFDANAFRMAGDIPDAHLDREIGSDGGGSGAVPVANATLKATVTWDGNTEEFSLSNTGD